MAILNLGSINWDRVLRVERFPGPGETIAARSSSRGVGGKGLNQSIAILRAGGSVRHLGAIGADDVSMRSALAKLDLDAGCIVGIDGVETGSATILVDPAGENVIVLDAGANARIPERIVEEQVARMAGGDWLLVQNETTQVPVAVKVARAAGLCVAMAAAPFEAGAIVPLLGDVDLMVMNAGEFDELLAATGGVAALPSELALLVTKGRDGACYRHRGGIVEARAWSVDVLDTTGAGDTCLGYFLALLDAGRAVEEALEAAMAAAALMVGRRGAAEAIPTMSEVASFLEDAS